MKKMCAQCGGSMSKMKSGGAKKKYAAGGFAPAQKGGDNTKMGIYGIPNAGNTGPETMKKGGSVKKKHQDGGSAMLTNTTPGEKFNPPMKKGGMVKNAKLAALAAPKNKITRADIITGAKKRAAKKK